MVFCSICLPQLFKRIKKTLKLFIGRCSFFIFSRKILLDILYKLLSRTKKKAEIEKSTSANVIRLSLFLGDLKYQANNLIMLLQTSLIKFRHPQVFCHNARIQ